MVLRYLSKSFHPMHHLVALAAHLKRFQRRHQPQCLGYWDRLEKILHYWCLGSDLGLLGPSDLLVGLLTLRSKSHRSFKSHLCQYHHCCPPE